MEERMEYTRLNGFALNGQSSPRLRIVNPRLSYYLKGFSRSIPGPFQREIV